MSKKNILWIGDIAWMKDNVYFLEAISPEVVSYSAFQQAIIEGIESNDYSVRILSIFDKINKKRIEWSHNDKSKDIILRGNKNKFLRIISRILKVRQEIKKGELLKDIDYVFVYSMHIPYLSALRKIKKKYPNIKTVLICPDLGIYMDLNINKKPIKALLKKIEEKIDKKLLKYVDGFILFTEKMREYFCALNKPSTIVEGVYRDKYSLNDANKSKFIMHAGTLNFNIGLEELILAFEKIENKTAELWFFGSGAMDDYIIEKSKENPRIKHMGFVDPQTLFEYEKQASLLVNVRDPKANFAQYSFPSKTFEYMASGTPFLTTNLPGIPEEYKEYLFIIESNEIEDIKSGIEKALSLTEKEREDFGKKARAFILENKNKYAQSKKVIEFLDELDN